MSVRINLERENAPTDLLREEILMRPQRLLEKGGDRINLERETAPTDLLEDDAPPASPGEGGPNAPPASPEEEGCSYRSVKGVVRTAPIDLL